jgi:hypothetical protein
LLLLDFFVNLSPLMFGSSLLLRSQYGLPRFHTGSSRRKYPHPHPRSSSHLILISYFATETNLRQKSRLMILKNTPAMKPQRPQYQPFLHGLVRSRKISARSSSSARRRWRGRRIGKRKCPLVVKAEFPLDNVGAPSATSLIRCSKVLEGIKGGRHEGSGTDA